uniref:Uncharacterized protein n=1 Tax=Romanomermis culicivorax TaxID=13658 RepID=A0A915HHQ2_ROMCU
MKEVNGNFACATCVEARRIYKCECCPVKAVKTDLIAGPSQKTYYCQKCYLCCECRARLMPDDQ